MAQFLANIAEGTGALSGSTTTGVTSQPTSFFSDERVKEDIVEIGRTHDGQRIIKFRYADEPKGTSHIGLSAQDVEKHHPEAVSETPEGIKAVDYDMATRHAERPPEGLAGALGASSEGGAVLPHREGLGFASGGGTSDYSQQIYQLMTQGARATPGGGGNPYGASGLAGYMPPLRQTAPRQLVRPNLPTPSALPSEFEQGLGAMQKVAQGTRAATDLYKMGKEGLVGAKGEKGEPDSGGLLGRGGKWDPESGWLGDLAKPSADGGARTGYADGGMPDPTQIMQGVFSQAPWAGGAAGATGVVPPQQAGAPRKLDAPKLTPPSSSGSKGGIDLAGASSAIDLAGKLKKGAGDVYDWAKEKIDNQKIAEATIPQGQEMAGLVNDAATQAAQGIAYSHGGRTGLNFGGVGALPGGQVSNPIVPEAVLQEGDKDEKLQAPGLTPPTGGGGGGAGGKDKTASTAMKAAGMAANFIPGVGPFISAGLNIGSAFVKDGGRVGYADGGEPTDAVPVPAAPTGVAPPKQDDFLGTLTPHVLKAAEQTGLDPRLILAQSALETGYGRAAPGHNYFGIKSHGREGGQQLQTQEYDPARGMYGTRESFRAYKSPEESAQDYANFINQNSRYQRARQAQGLDAQIAAMGESGYATDPRYAEKLRSIATNIEIDPKTGTARFIKPVQTYAPQSGLGAAEAPPAEDAGAGLTLQRYKSPMGVGISNRPERSAMDWLTSESTIVPGIAGIGAMLAGGSPYFLPNLGKGLYAGATAYGDLAKDIRRQDISQQQTDISQQQVDVQTMSELQKLYADMTKRRDLALRQGGPQAARQYDQRLSEIQDMILARSGVVGGVKRTGAPGGGAGDMPAGGAPAAGGMPAGGDTRPGGPGVPPVPMTTPKGNENLPYRTPQVSVDYRVTEDNTRVRKDSDPNYYRDLANNTMDPQVAKAYYDQANALENNIKQTGQVIDENGDVKFVRGWQKAKNQENYRAQNEKWQEAEANNRMTREVSKKQLQKISDILTQFQPGQWADAKGQIVAGLRSAGFNIPDTLMASPGATQIILKTAIQQAMDMANKGSSGMTNEKLGEARLASPHADLQPEAMQSIVADLKARLAYEDKFAKDFGSELNETPWVNRRQFVQHWATQDDNDYKKIYKQALNETPVLGVMGPVEIGQRRTLSPAEASKLWGRKITSPVVVDVVEGQNGTPTYRPVRQ